MPLILVSPYMLRKALNLASGNGVFDPYYEATMLLMHMDGNALTNVSALQDRKGAQFSVGSGSPQLVTGKFNGALRVGNTGYVRSTTKPFANIGTNDFTFEFFVRFNVLGAIGDHDYVNFDLNPIQIGMDASKRLCFEKYGGGWGTLVSTTAMDTSGTWVHVAIARQGTTTRMFFNGVQVATSTSLNGISLNQTGDFLIGARNNGGNITASGNYDIDEVRITRDYARYVTNFTPPDKSFGDTGHTYSDWQCAWIATHDRNNQAGGFIYSLPLEDIQKCTRAAIAYCDFSNPANPVIVPSSMYSFDIPAEWKAKHPFNYPGNDLSISAKSEADGTVTTGLLRFGYGIMNMYATDPWVANSGPWGRICITNTAAPFYNAWASANDPDNCSVSTAGVRYDATKSSPTRRFVILVK